MLQTCQIFYFGVPVCFMVVVATQPWGAQIRPFALAQYSALPKTSWEYLPKFLGEKIQDPDDHIKAVTIACKILGVQEEDIFVRLFARSLIENVVDWFQNLQDGRITCWDDLKVKFIERFRPLVDVGKMLSNFLQIRIMEDESIRDFIDRFNRCVGKIPLACQPTENNQLCILLLQWRLKLNFS